MSDRITVTNRPATPTDEAIAFLVELETRFRPRRRDLLQARAERARQLAAGCTPDVLSHTAAIRSGAWEVSPRLEVFDGRAACCPRRWTVDDPDLEVDGAPMAASLVDVGLALLAAESGRARFVLPTVDGHLEARVWNDVLCHAQDLLGIERGTVVAIARIETVTGAVEMDEILYELREHAAGLELAGDPSFVAAHQDRLSTTCRRRAACALTAEHPRSRTA